MPARPVALPENAGLAYLGETPWPPARLTPRQAESLLATRNPAGRPNSEALRSYVGQTGRRLRIHWQIDFPTHYRKQEAALHEHPFALLKKNNHATPGTWWINPHAQPPLRHALARVERFLATPLDASAPAWTWFESEHLPDTSLLTVARDDDFTHAVLQSTAFTAWWRAYRSALSPVQLLESFPFPWPPSTPLGSLSKTQQDQRSATTRAALSGDAEQINFTTATAYGWNTHQDPDTLLSSLSELHRQRAKLERYG